MPNYIIKNGDLVHAGVKGMRWGVRRFQNPDGSLTEAGKKRYGEGNGNGNGTGDGNASGNKPKKTGGKAKKILIGTAAVAAGAYVTSRILGKVGGGALKKTIKDAGIAAYILATVSRM